LPDGLRVRFSVRSELSFVVWAYPAQLAAQLPAEPLHPDYLSPAALVARSRVLTSAAVVGDVLQGAWGGRPFEAVQFDARTIALWPAKPRAGPRPAFVPLPAWLSAPRELALDAGILPPRVQLRRSPASAEAEGMAACERAAHLIGAADEGAGAARQRTDEEAVRAAGEEEGPEREPKRKRTAAAAPLSADEARAAAAAEGLVLEPSSSNETGFKGVRMQRDKFMARGREKGEQRSLGNFATAEEAALSYQRVTNRKRLEKTAALVHTVDEARAAAAAEGLELVPSSNKAGFKGVYMHHRDRYIAKGAWKGEQPYLGSFATAEEAGWRYQRWVKRKEAD